MTVTVTKSPDFRYRFAFRHANVHQHAGFLAAGDTVGVGVFLAEFAGDHHFDVAALECGEVLFGDPVLQRHQTVDRSCTTSRGS